jgi:hypothetical protein
LKLRTKMRLKFYLNAVVIISLTVVVGVFFSYLGWLSWQMKLGQVDIRYELFAAMAFILFVMTIVDIVLFLRLLLRRKYW